MRLKGQLPQQPLLRHYHHDEHDLDFDDEHFDDEHFNDDSHYLYLDDDPPHHYLDDHNASA